jgi:hypothetical protein
MHGIVGISLRLRRQWGNEEEPSSPMGNLGCRVNSVISLLFLLFYLKNGLE